MRGGRLTAIRRRGASLLLLLLPLLSLSLPSHPAAILGRRRWERPAGGLPAVSAPVGKRVKDVVCWSPPTAALVFAVTEFSCWRSCCARRVKVVTVMSERTS